MATLRKAMNGTSAVLPPSTATSGGAPSPTPKTHAAHGRPRLLRPLVLLVLAGAAVAAWRIFFAPPAVPDTIVTLSGRIEGDDSAVAPKVAGKILEVRMPRSRDRLTLPSSAETSRSSLTIQETHPGTLMREMRRQSPVTEGICPWITTCRILVQTEITEPKYF
jgi:hypothetical protein